MLVARPLSGVDSEFVPTSIHNDQSNHDDDSAIDISKLSLPVSSIPAVTHVNGTCRIQTVSSKTNNLFHRLLKQFYEKTGCPASLIPLSMFGEPIVATPEDAIRCLLYTRLIVWQLATI